MLDLYFRPFACSLASRIALFEAGVEARYHRVDLASHKLVADESDFFEISAKGQVAELRLEDGSLLTEGAAVLQRIADMNPESHLAPRPGDPERYRLQEWLNFVATELHKSFLAPTFSPDTPEEVKKYATGRVSRSLAVVNAH